MTTIRPRERVAGREVRLPGKGTGVTTIKSSAIEGERTLDVIVRNDGRVNLQINYVAGLDRLGIQVPTADLLAALDAVPGETFEANKADIKRGYEALEKAKELHEKLKAKLAEAQADAGRWGDELMEAQDSADNYSRADLLAALDAVPGETFEANKADIKRGYEALEKAKELHEKLKAKLAEAQADAGRWGDMVEVVRAALDREPFVLPTEAGARFEATHKSTGSRNEFKTYSDGIEAVYVLHEGTYWVAEDVMNGFEDFRLLDGAE